MHGKASIGPAECNRSSEEAGDPIKGGEFELFSIPAFLAGIRISWQ